MKILANILFLLISVPLSAQPTSSRIAYWKFDGNLSDAFGHNGTWTNTPAFGADRNNESNKALSIDFASYVTVSSQNDFDFGTGDFSISAWFKRPAAGAGVIASKQASGTYKGWSLYFDNGNVTFVAGSSPNFNVIKTSTAYGDNEWHHVVAVKKGSNANDWHIYVDSQEDTHIDQNDLSLGSTDITTTGAFVIGARDPGGLASFSGLIDDLIIYNRALTAPEATGIYEPSNVCNNIYCSQEGVGINTGEVPQGYSLAVKGKIIAEGVKVQYEDNWPDFVFDPDYNLKDLQQVKQFISNNNHLPGIPSAKEIKEEGVDVGDMNARLLLKIEEMTLYMIKMEERLQKLENENERLKAERH